MEVAVLYTSGINNNNRTNRTHMCFRIKGHNYDGLIAVSTACARFFLRLDRCCLGGGVFAIVCIVGSIVLAVVVGSVGCLLVLAVVVAGSVGGSLQSVLVAAAVVAVSVTAFPKQALYLMCEASLTSV